MKQQKHLQTALGKALSNTFGNRRRGGQARASIGETWMGQESRG